MAEFLRAMFDQVKRDYTTITGTSGCSKTNLAKLKKKIARTIELRNLCCKSKDTSLISVLFTEVCELLSDMENTESDWEENLNSVPSPVESPDRPPKPKKTKVDDFIEENEHATSVVKVVGRASAIIRDLEKDCELSNARIFALKLELEGRGTIENKEKDLFPDWLKRNETLGRAEKWMVAIILKLTPLSAVINKKLSGGTLSVISLCEIVNDYYSKWSKTYHKSRAMEPKSEAAWQEVFDVLDVTAEKDQTAIKIIFSEFREEGRKFDDEDVNNKNTDEKLDGSNTEKKPTKKSGVFILDGINYNATLEEIRNHFEDQKIVVDAVEHIYNFKKQTIKSGMIALAVNDFEGAEEAVKKIKEPILPRGYDRTIRIVEKHLSKET